MQDKPSYIKELLELYETYKGQEVADALAISLRQVQNYLKEQNPSKPSKEVINAIHEAFAKYKQGFPIQKGDRSDYKEKYILSLERENARLKKDLDLSLGELRHSILLTRAIAETTQELAAEFQAGKNKKMLEQILDSASIRNVERYKKLKEEGNFAYVGK